MTPVVVWGGAAEGELAAAPGEVARIFEVPLADLDVEPELVQHPAGAEAPVIRLPLFDRYVHAPTAAIIYQFCQLALHGNTSGSRTSRHPFTYGSNAGAGSRSLVCGHAGH